MTTALPAPSADQALSALCRAAFALQHAQTRGVAAGELRALQASHAYALRTYRHAAHTDHGPEAIAP